MCFLPPSRHKCTNHALMGTTSVTSCPTLGGHGPGCGLFCGVLVTRGHSRHKKSGITHQEIWVSVLRVDKVWRGERSRERAFHQSLGPVGSSRGGACGGRTATGEGPGTSLAGSSVLALQAVAGAKMWGRQVRIAAVKHTPKTTVPLTCFDVVLLCALLCGCCGFLSQV